MSSETAKNFVDTGSVERRADHDSVYSRECDLVGDLVFSQKDTDRHISRYMKFHRILEFVGHQLVASSTIF